MKSIAPGLKTIAAAAASGKVMQPMKMHKKVRKTKQSTLLMRNK
jgi:hypothetical protein